MCNDHIENPFEYDRGMQELQDAIAERENENGVLGRLLAEKDEEIRQLRLKLQDIVHLAQRG